MAHPKEKKLFTAFIIIFLVLFIASIYYMENGRIVKSGVFHSAQRNVSGEYTIYKYRDGSYVMEVKNYDASEGNEVYMFATPIVKAYTLSEVEIEGLKIILPTTNGAATLKGDFNVKMPEKYTPENYPGITIWSTAYKTFYGYAKPN